MVRVGKRLSKQKEGKRKLSLASPVGDGHFAFKAAPGSRGIM